MFDNTAPLSPSLSLFLSLSPSFSCVYLAFKIDEYIVSIDQFGDTIAPDLRKEVVEYVLSHEVKYDVIITS